MKQVNQVGVDVDSEALVCMMKRAGQPLPLATFANTAAGHKKFIRWVTKGARPAQICLEATGIYSLEFALALHHAKNVEVMVVNPRAIKDFTRACMQRAKTDAVDAGGILEYLERMPFVAWLTCGGVWRGQCRYDRARHRGQYPAPGAAPRAHARDWPATRAWRAGIGHQARPPGLH